MLTAAQKSDYHYELVGQVKKEEPSQDGKLLVTFLCSNKEEFQFFKSRLIKAIPMGTTVRVWVRRIPDLDGFLTRQSICLHWENL